MGQGACPFAEPVVRLSSVPRDLGEDVDDSDWQFSTPSRLGGCLQAHWLNWQAIGASPSVVTIVCDGYQVPFLGSPPPLTDIPVPFRTYHPGSRRLLRSHKRF